MLKHFLQHDHANEGIYGTFLIFGMILLMLLVSNSASEILFLALFFYVATIVRVFKQSFYHVSKNRFSGLTNLGILYGALVLSLAFTFLYNALFVVSTVVLLNLVIKKYNIIFHSARTNML